MTSSFVCLVVSSSSSSLTALDIVKEGNERPPSGKGGGRDKAGPRGAEILVDGFSADGEERPHGGNESEGLLLLLALRGEGREPPAAAKAAVSS